MITPNETTKLIACQSRSIPGSQLWPKLPNADSTALSTKETSNIKATPSTIVKESKRSLSVAQIERPGLGSTFQILFSEFCSWLKTFVEPQSRVNKLKIPARLATCG